MKKFLAAAAIFFAISPAAYAADECKIMAYKLDQHIVGDFVPILGDHISTGVIDAGNSESYTIPESAQMIRIVVSSDVWVNITTAGTDAVVDTDEFIPANGVMDRGSAKNPVAGKIVKCILDS